MQRRQDTLKLANMEFSPEVNLEPLNTFGLGGQARWFAAPTTLEELGALLKSPIFARTPQSLILGGGSNVLFTTDFEGCVITPQLYGIRLVGSTEDVWLVEVGAGEGWHHTVCTLMAQNLHGLENLALIPGTVGAAPVQNIGAYGLELKDRFAWLDAVEIESGETRRFDLAACEFDYRSSVFKHAAAGRFVIVSVTLALPKNWQAVTHYADIAYGLAERSITFASPQDIFEIVVATRCAKLPDPAVIGNAGSFFKNPVLTPAQAEALLRVYPSLPLYPQPNGTVKLAAAWLIDQCGFKGVRRGAAGVHERQALVLVNHGGATGSQLLALAKEIQVAVEARFGVLLQPELLII